MRRLLEKGLQKRKFFAQEEILFVQWFEEFDAKCLYSDIVTKRKLRIGQAFLFVKIFRCVHPNKIDSPLVPT